jgi:hypothetical protein
LENLLSVPYVSRLKVSIVLAKFGKQVDFVTRQNTITDIYFFKVVTEAQKSLLLAGDVCRPDNCFSAEKSICIKGDNDDCKNLAGCDRSK